MSDRFLFLSSFFFKLVVVYDYIYLYMKVNKEKNLFDVKWRPFLWVNSSIWKSQVSHRRRRTYAYILTINTDPPQTHTLDRFVLSSVGLYTLSLPVTTLKTSLSVTNNEYLFSHTNAKRCIIFFFTLKLTSSHSYTHSRNRMERGRKKRETGETERERTRRERAIVMVVYTVG